MRYVQHFTAREQFRMWERPHPAEEAHENNHWLQVGLKIANVTCIMHTAGIGKSPEASQRSIPQGKDGEKA